MKKEEKLHIIDINCTKEIKLFEAFAGIGSQRIALNNIAKSKNWTITSVGIIEWFVDAIIGYEIFHNQIVINERSDFNDNITISLDSKVPCTQTQLNKICNNSIIASYLKSSKENSNNLFDITKVNYKDIPKNIDIFTYSFPCQDLSNQGLQKGMNKESNTRSSLLWEIHRILKDMSKYYKNEDMPKYLLLENVKAILNIKHKPQLDEWILCLEKLGYQSKIYTLNALDFNMSQNRVRVFVLSVLKTHQKSTGFKFVELDDITLDNYLPIKTILDNDNHQFESKWNKYKLKEFPLTKNNIKKLELLNYSNFSSENFVFDINHSGPTLTASGALSRIKLFYHKNKIRTMNAIEAFRYMGVDKKYYQKLVDSKILSEIKMIYLAGNAIAIKVLEAIFSTLRF